jgi:hypothetical protein
MEGKGWKNTIGNKMRTRWEQKHPTAPLSSPNELVAKNFYAYVHCISYLVKAHEFGRTSKMLFYFTFLTWLNLLSCRWHMM